MFETAKSIFDEECGGMWAGLSISDKKYNALWGPEYVVCFSREPDERGLDGLIAGMIMLRAFD